MKLKIVATGMTGPGRQTKIYLDDKELTGVHAVSVDLDVDSVNTAVIEFYPSEIEIEGEYEVKAKKWEEWIETTTMADVLEGKRTFVGRHTGRIKEVYDEK